MKKQFVVQDCQGRFFQYGFGFIMAPIYSASLYDESEIEQLKRHYPSGSIKKYQAKAINGQTVITGPAEDF